MSVFKTNCYLGSCYLLGSSVLEVGTLAPKNVGDAPLICVVIRTVRIVGVRKGVV
jgi:hypothetical protein